MVSEIWLYVGLVFLPFLLMAAGGVMAYYLNPKFRAFTRGKAVIRIVDESSGRERETVGEYNPAKGWARVAGKAWEINKDDVLTAFPSVPIITVSASKAVSINTKGKNLQHQYSPDTLESALIAMYAAARSAVTSFIESLAIWIKANTVISIIILLMVLFVFLQFDPLIKTQAAQAADIASIKNLLNQTIIGKGKVI